jgi:glycosyltransferase involved in cell wall biosynthesis
MGVQETVMKHALVFVVTTPFAANAFLRKHLLALAESHDVTLCVNTDAYPLADEIAKVVRVCHIDITRKISLWKDLRALLQLIRCFLANRPVVVHSITPKAGLLAMLGGWLTRVPWRFHTFTGQIWANSSGIKRVMLKAIDGLIAFFASRVFADSASQCRLLERENVVRKGGVTVIGSGSIAGVDLSRFRPDQDARTILRAEQGIASDTPVFIFVGRLVRDKGVFDLVDAFASVNSHHPNWEMWVVGPDEDSLLLELQARGDRLGARIRWFASTACPERFMAAADVFVLPSYREGFGSVIIEAAACGVPCIAYRIDGVVDAIVDRQTGVFVDKGSICGLSEAMNWLGSADRERSAMGEAARVRAVSEFSSSTVSKAWLYQYEECLKKAV